MSLDEEDIDRGVIERDYHRSPPCDAKSFNIGYRAALSAIVEGKHPGVLMRANCEQHSRLEKELQKEYNEYHNIKNKKGGSAGKCPYCGKEMVKHIIKEGARYHVTSWYKGENGGLSHCSEPNCENNHGPGHCVPREADPFHGLSNKERLKKIFESFEEKEKNRKEYPPKYKG